MVKVSVIVPIYNAEAYLEECLDSIAGQTLKEMEIICVNDGSSDESAVILKRYREKYGNMTVIHQENRGASCCRNKGIRLAEGQFVCFMDADDFYPSNDILEVLYDKAAGHGVKICGGSFSCYDRGKIITGFTGEKAKYIFTEERMINFRDYQWDFGYTRFIYDSRFLKRNRLEFPELKRYQDPPFFSRAMILAEEFYAVDKVVYCCRTGHQNYRFPAEKLLDIMSGMKTELKLSAEHGMADLHACIFRRLNEDLYSRQIYREIVQGNEAISRGYRQLAESIDYPLLGRAEAAEQPELRLKVLRLMEEYTEIRAEEADFLRQIKRFGHVLIYGAGRTGKAVAGYLVRNASGKDIRFAVSEGMEHPEKLDGMEVKEISSYEKKQDSLLIIAVLPKYRKELTEHARELGFENLWVINDESFANYTYNL